MNDFEETFRPLTGNSPFPWQKRLYELFLEGRFPEKCHLPMGLIPQHFRGLKAAVPLKQLVPDDALIRPRSLGCSSAVGIWEGGQSLHSALGLWDVPRSSATHFPGLLIVFGALGAVASSDGFT